METRKSLKQGKIDFLLFIAIVVICAFGLVMLFSASYYYAQAQYGDGFKYLKNQGLFMFLGMAAMIGLSFLDYHFWEKIKLPALLITLVLMVLVIFVGVDINGAQRWLAIELGGFSLSFQPSELAKFALILYMASFMSQRSSAMKSFKYGLMPMLLIIGIMSVIILLQKNMSMMVIVVLMGMIMLYVGGASVKHLVWLVIAAIPLFFIFAKIEPYRWERLTIFTNPWKDPRDSGYQLIQSLYAFGSGGLFGQGLNFSRQKLLFLTYGESDFIFAIIGEELGWVGCVLVIAAYAFVIYRGIRIALRCKDKFGSLFAAGITLVLAVQVAVNIGVATSSIPPTGQTLPFISSGGTSLFIFLAAMGILLNISRHTELQ
ncbi:MAG: putative lipid II flippase FtsW [Clostridia bacterium]|nr:putative lipid II flippase FtsW [Clostridia bacterium]